MRLAAISMAALLSACDPGGTYHVPGARAVTDDGRQYVLAGPSQTSLQAYASWFTSTISTVLTIKNDGTTPLTIRPDKARLFDCDGNAVDLKRWAPQPTCIDRVNEAEVTLVGGESCRFGADFEVVPNEKRLRTLTLIHDGVTRGSASVPIAITFELDRDDLALLRAIDLHRRCVTPRRAY